MLVALCLTLRSFYKGQKEKATYWVSFKSCVFDRYILCLFGLINKFAIHLFLCVCMCSYVCHHMYVLGSQ